MSTKDWMLGDSLFQFRLQKWLRFRTSFGPSTPEKGGVVRRLPCKVSGSRKDKKRGASFFASNLETGNRKSPLLMFIQVWVKCARCYEWLWLFAKIIFAKNKFQVYVGVAAAAVAKSVKHPGLRSLKRGAAELTWVGFPVVAKEQEKHPSLAK